MKTDKSEKVGFVAAVVPGAFLAVSVILMILDGDVDLYCTNGVFSLSCCIAIELCYRDVRRKNVFIVVALQILSFALLAALDLAEALDTGPFRGLYFSVASFFPALAVLSGGILRRCGDPAYLSSMESGINVVRRSSLIILALYVLVSMCVSSAALMMPEPVPEVVSAFMLICLLSLFIVLSARLALGRKRLSVVEEAILLPSARPEADVNDVAVFRKIDDLMSKDKPFLDPGFTLERLCREIGVNRGYVSKSINNCTGLTFPRYINNLRVRYAQDLFISSGKKLRIAVLAERSGFANGVTFAVSFRLVTGMAPRDWCRKVRGEGSSDEGGGNPPVPF